MLIRKFWVLTISFIIISSNGCTTINSYIYPERQEETTSAVIEFQPTEKPATEMPTYISTAQGPRQRIAHKPILTLEPAIAMKTIQPLLTQPLNYGSVPCFWGVIPGKTTLTEVREFFGSLGFEALEGIDPSTEKNFYSITYDTSNGKTSGLGIHFDTSNLVESMMISPDIPTPNIGEPPEFVSYSPDKLIKMYGNPSKVNFYIGLGQMTNIFIDMTMYFENADVIVNYHGYHMTPDNFCPSSAPFDFVRLWLGKNPQHTPSYETLPLEKVSTLNTEEFSQLLLGDPQKACFSLKVDMFK